MTAWDDKLLSNPHAVADKRTRVQKMFAAIAPSYDINNRLHSLWMDQKWRNRAVELTELKARDQVVDVACGTGDLALAFNRALWLAPDQAHVTPDPYQVLGVDFTFAMLPIAKEKAASIPLPRQFESLDPTIEVPKYASFSLGFCCGDGQSLPFGDQTADVVSIAFGIRNVQEPLLALKEFHRILCPGGRVIILEFSLPTNPILRSLYNFYFRNILPVTATLISGDKTGAYKYLPESVNTFIGRQQMVQMMQEAGFERIEQFPLTFGVCVVYRGFVG